jgi:hypothetical protein
VIVECATQSVDADINRQVRAAIPGVLSVDVRVPAVPEAGAAAPRADGSLAPRELYTMFRAARRDTPATTIVLEAFDDLYEAATAEEAVP